LKHCAGHKNNKEKRHPGEWWPVIDSIYNSIGLFAPVASSEQPMDRIAQHLGNMGI